MFPTTSTQTLHFKQGFTDAVVVAVVVGALVVVDVLGDKVLVVAEAH